MRRQNGTTTQESDGMAVMQGVLAERLLRWTSRQNNPVTAIPALSFHRCDAPTQEMCYIYEPSVCLVAQGAKRILLGDDVYEYDANHYLITSVDLPVVAQVTEASADKPYLGLVLKLDQRMIAQLLVDSNLPLPRVQQADRGMAVSEVSFPLLDAIQRLVDLLDEPEDIPILAPLVQREILYRLLVGEQGPHLRQIATAGSHSHKIARAIAWLKGNFAHPIRVDDLAARIGMSPSTFYHNFRALTAMSPLQFQKWLRLHEARRLMFIEYMDAADAAFQVGYESPSQFSREYSRMFGAPPLRDVRNLQRLTTLDGGGR